MKKLKINYAGLARDFDPRNNLILQILSEKFDVEISDNPDFVFVMPNCHKEERYDFLKYDCVRILYTFEPYSVDFNFYDYAIGFDYMTMLDKNGKNRYYRFPHCFNRFLYKDIFDTDVMKYGMSYEEAKKILIEKKDFCTFIYSHHSYKGEREKIFSQLNRYKKVDSAGTYLNNMQNGFIADYDHKEQKQNFVKNHKFDIASESVSFPGFVTEKIVDNFLCNSIPIYFGDPFVSEIFNQKAFINANGLSNTELLKQIKKIDNNDDLYIEMLMQPKLKYPEIYDEYYNGLKEFLWHICSQTRNDAYRRQRCFSSQWHEENIIYFKNMTHQYKKTLFFRLRKSIRKIGGKILRFFHLM